MSDVWPKMSDIWLKMSWYLTKNMVTHQTSFHCWVPPSCFCFYFCTFTSDISTRCLRTWRSCWYKPGRRSSILSLISCSCSVFYCFSLDTLLPQSFEAATYLTCLIKKLLLIVSRPARWTLVVLASTSSCSHLLATSYIYSFLYFFHSPFFSFLFLPIYIYFIFPFVPTPTPTTE